MDLGCRACFVRDIDLSGPGVSEICRGASHPPRFAPYPQRIGGVSVPHFCHYPTCGVGLAWLGTPEGQKRRFTGTRPCNREPTDTRTHLVPEPGPWTGIL